MRPTLWGVFEGSAKLGEVFPVVAFARRVPGADYVGIDNERGALLAIEHLYRIEHRRIAFLGGNPNPLSGDDRLKGYQQALSQLKVKFDPLLVVPSDLNRRSGIDGVQKLIRAKTPPIAVLCFNDVVALGAMEGIQHLGLKPGVDFEIVGFNNIPDAAQCIPGLTTIENSPRQLGESAAELLLKGSSNEVPQSAAREKLKRDRSNARRQK